jgi:hypothetical protein
LKEYLERQFRFTYILDREPIESEGLHEMCEGCKAFFGCDCDEITRLESEKPEGP